MTTINWKLINSWQAQVYICINLHKWTKRIDELTSTNTCKVSQFCSCVFRSSTFSWQLHWLKKPGSKAYLDGKYILHIQNHQVITLFIECRILIVVWTAPRKCLGSRETTSWIQIKH